jgi:hypothetical protein
VKTCEAFLAEDLGDAGAIEGCRGVLEGLGDLVEGQALAAEPDDVGTGGLLGGGGLGPGAGDDEEVEVTGAEVAEQRGQGVGGVADASGGLLQGETRTMARGEPAGAWPPIVSDMRAASPTSSASTARGALD